MVSEDNGSKLFYSKEGNGPQPLLFFHGFGQDHSVFLPIARTISSRYTCYLFDLYFHGQSAWQPEEIPLEKEKWKALITRFLDENHITQFSLAGFSLGSKLALAILEAFPERTKEMFLIAPDGIRTSFWYSLATYPAPLRRLFKSMITHPQRFFNLANGLQAIGLLDKGLQRFAGTQMNTEEKRRRVYRSWVTFRRLKFDMPTLASIINHHHIAVTVITGRFDKVIRSENMTHLTKHLQHHNSLVIDAGHNGLLTHPAVSEALSRASANRA